MLTTFLFVFSIWSVQAAANAEPHEELTVCRLAADPQRFAGKYVVVKGMVVAGVHDTFLRDSACDIPLVLDGDNPSSSGPGSDSVKELWKTLANYRLEDEKNRPNLEGVFEGIFETAFKVENGKVIRTGKGFGNMSLGLMRLRLRKVSHLTRKPAS